MLVLTIVAAFVGWQSQIVKHFDWRCIDSPTGPSRVTVTEWTAGAMTPHLNEHAYHVLTRVKHICGLLYRDGR
jgi:hypothetical protein